jgi:hypothetical protein
VCYACDVRKEHDQRDILQNQPSNVISAQFIESQGAAISPVLQAFFGAARLAKDRIHWMFPPDKDERVSSSLAWIQVMSDGLGTFGVGPIVSCVLFIRLTVLVEQIPADSGTRCTVH